MLIEHILSFDDLKVKNILLRLHTANTEKSMGHMNAMMHNSMMQQMYYHNMNLMKMQNPPNETSSTPSEISNENEENEKNKSTNQYFPVNNGYGSNSIYPNQMFFNQNYFQNQQNVNSSESNINMK